MADEAWCLFKPAAVKSGSDMNGEKAKAVARQRWRRVSAMAHKHQGTT
jgi:xanthine dehydrogenase molybdopterin-binding subunit B